MPVALRMIAAPLPDRVIAIDRIPAGYAVRAIPAEPGDPKPQEFANHREALAFSAGWHLASSWAIDDRTAA